MPTQKPSDKCNTWYRPIGISFGSDYYHWQKDIKLEMGPDFIGYLIATTSDGRSPYVYGQNVINMGFMFFNRIPRDKFGCPIKERNNDKSKTTRNEN